MGLEQVELVMEIEDELGIAIEAEDQYGQAVNTVGAFYDLVLRVVRESAGTKLLRRVKLEEYVWDVVAKLAAEHGYGLKAEEITRETRFIEDLGYG
jgi:acyl carrier protein